MDSKTGPVEYVSKSTIKKGPTRKKNKVKYHNHRIWISHIPYFTSFIFSICNMESSKELRLQIWPKKHNRPKVPDSICCSSHGLQPGCCHNWVTSKNRNPQLSTARHGTARARLGGSGVGGLRPPYWRTCCRAVMSCIGKKPRSLNINGKAFATEKHLQKKKRGIFFDASTKSKVSERNWVIYVM